MKENVKRLMTLALAVLLTISTILPYMDSLATEYFFQDNFGSSISSSWVNQSAGSVSEGVYNLKAGEFNYVAGSENTDDTIVTADVSMVIEKGKKHNGYASIMARASADMKTGYGFAIGVAKTGSSYVRLYRLDANGNSEILRQMTDDIPGIGKLKKTKTYALTLLVQGNRILAMIDGNVFADMTDDALKHGYSGVKTDGIAAKVDNYKLSIAPEMKTDKMKVVSHSEKVAPYEKINFEIDVEYNSIYGKTTINQDSEGVIVSGYDGKPGSKKVTVSYMGGEASFYVLITAKYNAQTLWNDDFSQGTLSDKYTGGSYTDKNYNFTYAFQQKNDKLNIDIPNLNGGDVYGMATLYVKEETAKDWNSYSISTDSTIYEDWPTKTARYAHASLVFAKSGTTDFTYRINTQGNLILAKGSNNIMQISLETLDFELVKGKKFSMRVDVHGDWADFYLDSKKVASYWFAEKLEPAAGIMAANGKVQFDNFKVTSLQEYSKWCMKDMTVVDTGIGEVKTVRAKSLFSNILLLKCDYWNGFTDYEVITEDMVKGYNEDSKSSEPQTITVTYGGKTVSFQYIYAKYLFQDTFDGKELGSRWIPTGNQNYFVKNGKLNLAYEYNNVDEQSRASKYFYGTVSKGDSWTDYTVTVNSRIYSMSYAKSQVIYIRARINGSNYYQFYYGFNSAGQLAMGLDRVHGLDSVALDTYQNREPNRILCDENGDPKTDIKIQLSLCGNVIQAYVDDQLISTYYDNSESALTSGTAGIYANALNGYVEDFTVEETTPKIISGLSIADDSDNSFDIYEGGYIELWDKQLKVSYTNGGSDNIPFAYDMLSDYDSTALGKQRVNVTYQGFTDTVYVNVSERPDYVKQIEQNLENFTKTLQQSDLSAFQELKRQYDTLSNYEAEQLGKSLLKKYKDLCNQADALYYGDIIANEDLVLDGSLSSKSKNDWEQLQVWRNGKWFHLDDKIYHGEAEYNGDGRGLYVSKTYGDIKALSSDVYMLADQMYVGVLLNSCDYGYYALWINGTAQDQEGNYIYKMELSRYNGSGTTVLDSCILLDYGIEIKPREWYNLCIVEEEGVLTGYLNGQKLLTYNDLSRGYFTEGWFGVAATHNNALYDNVRAYGKEHQAPKDISNVQPTKYDDDFEDEAIGGSPSHWVETSNWETKTDVWKVKKVNGSKMYGTTGSDDYTSTWLHVFEKNPDISMKFVVNSNTSNGKFGFLTRMSPETAFVKIGYDFSSSKWYICDQESKNGGNSFYYSDEKYNLKNGKEYTAHIVMEEMKVSLYINDKLILSTEELEHVEVGRVGVFVEGASVYIDDVHCTFSGADIPQDGILTYEINPEKGNSLLELEQLPDGSLVGIGNRKKYISYNEGETWKEITTDSEWDDVWMHGTYTSVVQLHNGTYLQVRTQVSNVGVMEEEAFSVLASKDFKNWNTIGRILTEEEKLFINNSNYPMTHIDSIVEFQLADGTWRIFLPLYFYDEQTSCRYTKVYYSDDGGVTWKGSENSTMELIPEGDKILNMWQESKLVQCSDGTIRLYCPRTYFGCMQYTESTDGGVTWSGLKQIPEIQAPLASFDVIEDPSEPGTWYMIWVNCKGFYVGSIETRNRLCMARSYDGKNWEFLMNVEWMSDYISVNGNSLYQLVDNTLYVTDDYIHVVGGRSAEEISMTTANSHQRQVINYVRIEKDKIQARAWDSSTVSNMNFVSEVAFEKMPQTKFGQGDLFVIAGDSTVKTKNILGTETIEPFQKNTSVYSQPNMNKLGKQTVVVRYRNGMDLSYEIEIVPNYRIKWTVSEGGKVVNQDKKIMEGATKEFELLPNDGYKVDSVFVNGTEVTVRKNKFTVENVKSNIEIEVNFAEKTIADYLRIILLNLVVIGGGTAVYVVLRKRKKQNAEL